MVHVLASFPSEVVASCSLLGSLSTIAPNALASRTEETLHAIQVAHILLGLLLRLTLATVHFVVGTLALQVPAVVSKSAVVTSGPIRVHGLHLAFQSVIDALSLVHLVVEALGARD